MRAVGSTHVDPYSADAAGVAALSGPMRGAADEAVLQTLRRIGTVANVPDFLTRVKTGHERLMGFGHWMYKTHDPRARILREEFDRLYESHGRNPLAAIAHELERRALDDEFFTSRRVYPNVGLYSGLTYEAIGVPATMFPVCSLWLVARSGSPNGSRWSATPSSRRSGHGRSTPANSTETTSQSPRATEGGAVIACNPTTILPAGLRRSDRA